MQENSLWFVLFCRVLQFLKLLSLYLTSSIHCFPVGQTLLLLLLVRLLNSSLHCHQGGVRVFLLFCHKERIHLSHDYFKLSQTKIKIVDCYINYTKLLHKIINYRVVIDWMGGADRDIWLARSACHEWKPNIFPSSPTKVSQLAFYHVTNKCWTFGKVCFNLNWTW